MAWKAPATDRPTCRVYPEYASLSTRYDRKSMHVCEHSLDSVHACRRQHRPKGVHNIDRRLWLRLPGARQCIALAQLTSANCQSRCTATMGSRASMSS